MSNTSETRGQNALKYLEKLSPSLAKSVRAKYKPSDGAAISLGFGHGAFAGLSEEQRDGLRALLLCHMVLNPSPDIQKQLPEIRQFFTTQKTAIRKAIESFVVKPVAGPLHLSIAAAGTYTQGMSETSWRGDKKVDLGTCWNFVASCAFQAGIISLQKCLGEFFVTGSGGPAKAARVLMNNTLANKVDFHDIAPGFVVGFYRCPAQGAGGQLTHVTIATGNSSCKGVRQPSAPMGVQEVKIDAIVKAMKPSKTEAVRVRVCNPQGMENR